MGTMFSLRSDVLFRWCGPIEGVVKEEEEEEGEDLVGVWVVGGSVRRWVTFFWRFASSVVLTRSLFSSTITSYRAEGAKVSSFCLYPVTLIQTKPP